VKRFPKPDIALAQHVMSLPAGRIAIRSGPVLSMSDSWEVKLFGRGGYGSGPEFTVDPVVMAAATVMRLQTVVSREISMMDRAVVTVGAMQAGSSPNIIPDDALLRLNVRTFDEQVRETVLSAIKRIINAEATASHAPKPPAFTVVAEFPLTSNDEAATARVTEALQGRFGSDVQTGNPATASEDFSNFARTWDVPSVFWFVGGTDPQKYAEAENAGRLNDLPSNHSPQFAPITTPTLRMGVEAMLAAAGPWLTRVGAKPQ
jgi:hippurate hydrolase